METKALEELKQSVADVVKAAEGRAGKSNKDTVQELIKAAVEKSRTLGRKGEAFVDLGEDLSGASMDRMLVTKSVDEKVIDFQRQSDDIYLLSKILRIDPKSSRLYKQFSQSELKKAMDATTAGEGGNWVPTQFSADLIDKIRLALKVAALHQTIQMPTNPYTLPIVSSDATGYLVAENTLEPENATRITASTPGTGNKTLTAKKIGARVSFSEELSEDSIIPILPFVKTNVSRALGEAIETAIINGDTDATHMDSDVTAATDAQKAWDGYRKLAQVTVNLGTFSLANLRLLRSGMAKYGVDIDKLAWVVSIIGFNKFLDLTETRTVDKYGPEATVLKGELAKLDGIPVIISEKQKENLNAVGVYDGTTVDKTVLQLVHRDSLIIGDRRSVTVKTDENIETDQTILVSTLRQAFREIVATTDGFVANGFNIAT